MLRFVLLFSLIVLFAGCATNPPRDGAAPSDQKPSADRADPMSPGLDWLNADFWDHTPNDYHLAPK